MPDFGGYGFDREWLKRQRERRVIYAAKLRALGVIENSNKWRELMWRKRL